MGGKERFWRKKDEASEERQLRGLRVLSRKGEDEEKGSENAVGKMGSVGGERQRAAVIEFMPRDTMHHINTLWSLLATVEAHPESLSLYLSLFQ